MYQFASPIRALEQGSISAPISNSIAVAIRQLAEAKREAR